MTESLSDMVIREVERGLGAMRDHIVQRYPAAAADAIRIVSEVRERVEDLIGDPEGNSRVESAVDEYTRAVRYGVRTVTMEGVADVQKLTGEDRERFYGLAREAWSHPGRLPDRRGGRDRRRPAQQ